MISMTIMPLAAAATVGMMGEEATSLFAQASFALGAFFSVVYMIIGHLPGR